MITPGDLCTMLDRDAVLWPTEGSHSNMLAVSSHTMLHPGDIVLVIDNPNPLSRSTWGRIQVLTAKGIGWISASVISSS